MATPPPPAQPSTEEPPFRVLVIISRPLDESELPNIADQWALYSGLSAVKTPARLDFLRPPTIEQLRTEILGGYDVVHFDGHGAFGLRCPSCSGLNPPEGKKCGRCDAVLEDEKAGGYLAFEREDGTVDSLAAEDLAMMINAVPGRPTKLVILSACESAKGGDASLLAVLKRAGVPAVLGMKEPVPVDLTVALSRPLYAYMGAGLEIGEAFSQALSSISKLPQSELGTPAPDIPVLEGDGTGAQIVDRPMRGEVVVERERIFGVPEYDFVGEFIRGDPPRGRKGLLARTVRSLLAGERLVVLTGQGGIGKSVLGAEAARRVAWRYPGGVFWRSAADIEKLGLNELLDAFARPEVFGYEFRTLPIDTKRDRVLDYLRNMGTASLIVVDNAETIKDQALWRFLEGIPKPSAALVTSREALEREGAHIDIDEMEPSEATRLFIVEARRRKPGWGEKLTSSDLKAMGDISGHLDGHPLAIKLAAAMVGSDSLATICQRVLAAPHKEVSTRFDFSYNPLPESEKELLHRMAAFASSATEEVIKLTCTHSDFAGDDVLPQWRDDLSELVRKSFVDTVDMTAFDDSGNEVTWQRYRLHPLMRQYASGKAGEEAMKNHRKRAANFFLSYATLFEKNYNALQAEHENILAGMDWAVETKEKGKPEQQKEAAEMILGFNSTIGHFPEGYLFIRGYWTELKQLLETATNSAAFLDYREYETACIVNLAILSQSQGDYKKARESHEKFLQIFKESGRKDLMAVALHQLGMLAQDTGDIAEARRLYGESLKILQELGGKSGVAISLHQLGMLAQDTGDIAEARRLYGESLKIKQELGDKSGVAISLHQLGIIAQTTGDLAEARRLYGESLKINQELGDKSGVASSLHQLGIIAQTTGDLAEARRLYGESLKIKQELGDKSGVASSMAQLGQLAELEKDYVSAVSMWMLAYSVFDELQSPKKDVVGRWLARLQKELGETEFEKVWKKAMEKSS